jgi:hypothetical protein
MTPATSLRKCRAVRICLAITFNYSLPKGDIVPFFDRGEVFRYLYRF